MEDRKQVNESINEMKDSPKNNDDCEGALQDMSEESSKNPTTIENQVLPSFGQDSSQKQQLPSGISTETSSRPFVPTSAFSSQAVKIDSTEKDAGLLKLEHIPSDQASSSNLEPISNPQNSSTKDCELSMELEPQEEFLSVSSVETKSASIMAHSTTEIQMLESSQSMPMIENFDLPSRVLDSKIEIQGFETSPSSRISLNPHVPEQISFSDIHIPPQVLDLETCDEKLQTDQNRSDSSPPTSNPNLKSISESKESSLYGELEMLQRSLSDEMSTFRNLPEIPDPGALMQENWSDLLLRRQHSGSISSGASTSRERSEVRMDLDPPCLDACEGVPSASSYQPVISDFSSAGDRCNSSSGVTLSGEEAGRAMISKTSATRISKYASNAQKLLLTVLEEMMKFNEEMEQYKRFHDLFLCISKFPCFVTERGLWCELMWYLIRRRTAFGAKIVFTSPELTLEYRTKQIYWILIIFVVSALSSTVSVQSSLDFESIMATYKNFKEFYRIFSDFCINNDVKDIQDEASRNLVECLTDNIHALILQTRNAFRELLMHIGEHGDQFIINSYEEQLFEEDKFYLKRLTFF